MKTEKPCIFSIFGASGDLAKIKIYPALFNLAERKKLPKEYWISGFARTKMTQKEFQETFKKSVKKERENHCSAELLEKMAQKLHYFTGHYDNETDFKKYLNSLKKITKGKSFTHIIYFSVPPVVFKDIVKNLGENIDTKKEDVRLVIEKPFGTNKTSARELFHFTAQYFHDEKLYLLDHYLGKIAVQSLLHLRHSNRILNLIMKGGEIANIQVTALEDIGVHDRVGYFEQVGTLKDMIQSHLLQVLSFITMSIPISEQEQSIHREKYNILSALQFLQSANNIVLGQYESYKNLKGVPKDAKTNTFVAVRLYINRESWYRVPIYIRTGKMLHEKHTFIVVEFKKFLFQKKSEPPNRLIIDLAPDEKISIKLVNKVGRRSSYEEITTSHSLACEGDDCLPEHALLLLDVMNKNRMHFLSFPEIIASWRVIDSISQCIEGKKVPVEMYQDHSEGPQTQHRLTQMDGFEWFDHLHG